MNAQRRAITISIVAVLLLAAAAPAKAQNYAVVHAFGRGGFKDLNTFTNVDGVNPFGGLVASGGRLYGAANLGGTNGTGTIFALNPDGSGFTVLHHFSVLDPISLTNTDGANPSAGLLAVGGLLYGTAYNGGVNGAGTVFSLSTNGTGFAVLYSFAGGAGDGASPAAGLLLVGPFLYGTTYYGGNQDNGVVFALNTNGVGGISILKTFPAADPNTSANSDGANPSAGLILSGTTLYGTTVLGGTYGRGVIFAINTNINGAGFSVLHHCDTNSQYPAAGLALSGRTLYGLGGNVAFSLDTNGTGFNLLHQFANNVGDTTFATAGLTFSSGTLYGAAPSAGAFTNGVAFAMTTNGNAFSALHDFTASGTTFPPTNSDGSLPNGGPLLLNGTLYGTTGQGSASGSGVVYRISPSPVRLSWQLSGGNFILRFPTIAGQSYTILRNTNLAQTNWVAFTNLIGSGPAGQVSIPTAGSPRLFFRLRQP